METRRLNISGDQPGQNVSGPRRFRGSIADSIALIIRLALGVVFLWSGLAKLAAPLDFLHAVYSYELVGPRLGLVIAAVLPAVELALALCLIGGIMTGGALLTSTLLALVFVLAQMWALRQGLDIVCGCLGPWGSRNTISSGTVLRPILMLVAGLAAYIQFLRQPVGRGSRDGGQSHESM